MQTNYSDKARRITQDEFDKAYNAGGKDGE